MIVPNHSWFVRHKVDRECASPAYQSSFDTRQAHSQNPLIFINGYILPKMKHFEEFKHLSQERVVETLYQRYSYRFIEYIKGIFTIIFLYKNRYLIFTDRHSIEKYFIFNDGKEIIVSNSLRYIAEAKDLEIDIKNAYLYLLLSHYINGHTLFKYVNSSSEGEYLEYKDSKLSRKKYWDPKDLFVNFYTEKISPVKQAETWKTLLNNYIEYLEPNGITLTLTGGNDSRMVLAGLLSSRHPLKSFTYGDVFSQDALIAKKIAQTCSIRHDVYNIDNPTVEWFSSLGEKIIQLGNSLVNIHRAHRLYAVGQDVHSHPENNMLFTGLVGGEYQKKPINNGKVIPKLVWNFIDNVNEKVIKTNIKKELDSRALTYTIDIIDQLYDELRVFSEKGAGLNKNRQIFIASYSFYGCTHHIQDSILFKSYYEYLINPFMDIDFLELLSLSNEWYANNSKPYNRLFHSRSLAAITHILAPSLSNIPYAKRGEYTANDIVNHRLRYLLRRVTGCFSKKKVKYPSSFPMGKWLQEFCAVHINKLPFWLRTIVDIELLMNLFHKVSKVTTESDWHVITNLINLGMADEYYRKN